MHHSAPQPHPTNGASAQTQALAVAAGSECAGGLLDIEGVARILGVTIRHVRRLVAEKRIPYIKVGHYVRFDRRDVDEWISERRVPSLSEGSAVGSSRRGHRGPGSRGQSYV